MKTLIRYGATAVVVAMAATVLGQSEIANGSNSTSAYMQTSKLVGRKVKTSEGEEIGVVKDVVIDRSNGCMAYTVLSTGGEGTGVISGGGKIVAVPWAVYSHTSDLSVLTVKVDRDKIFDAPAFDYTRMDEYARPDYMDNVYSYYGVSPGPGKPVATSSETTAGTDVTGTAGATASPGEVAPPAAAATETGASKKRPSATNPSAEATRSPMGIGARPSIDHGKTARSSKIEDFPSEGATSPNKQSRRKAINDTRTRTPGATPQSAQGQD